MAFKMPWSIKDRINIIKSNLSDGYNFGDISLGWYGFDRNSQDEPISELQNNILGQVVNDSRNEFLEDRKHTEEREDTAYQRAVADMQKAGLNPYTISTSGASSSTSQVGEQNIASKVQLLGYILNLQNLDARNTASANQLMSNMLKIVGRASAS